MPVSLQQQFATPFSVAQASPIQNNALSENPNVMYALDDQGNRLFPYALTPEMDKSLLPLLSETVNRACRSQLGRDTLRQASEMGHSFMLYTENDGRGGFYNDFNRSVCMNANESKDFICSALIHEARHSIQFDQVPEFRETFRNNNLDFKSYMIVNRAIEADAVAVQTKFAYELAQLGDRGPFDAVKGQFPAVAGSIEQAAEKGKLDHTDTLKNAADSWYKSFGIVHWYDDYYSKVEKGRIAMTTEQKKLSDGQLDRFVENLFKVNNTVYAGNSADYLKSPEKLSLSEEGYLNVQSANAACGKTDISVDDMFAVNPNTYRPMDFTHRQKAEMSPEQLTALYLQQTPTTFSVQPPPPPPPPKDKEEKISRTFMNPLSQEQAKAMGLPPLDQKNTISATMSPVSKEYAQKIGMPDLPKEAGTIRMNPLSQEQAKAMGLPPLDQKSPISATMSPVSKEYAQKIGMPDLPKEAMPLPALGKTTNLEGLSLHGKLMKIQKTLDANKENSAVNVAEIIQNRVKNSRS